MKTYDEMNDLEYSEAVMDYADLFAALADGWTKKEVIEDLKECIGRGGDGFIETMTDAELEAFAESVMRRIDEYAL